MNLSLCYTIACLFMLTSLQSYAADARRKPNIIYVLADDLGWTDLGV